MAGVMVGMLCYGGKRKKRAIKYPVEISLHLRSGDLGRRAKTLPKRKSLFHPNTIYKVFFGSGVERVVRTTLGFDFLDLCVSELFCHSCKGWLRTVFDFLDTAAW